MTFRIAMVLWNSPQSFAPHLRQKFMAHYPVVLTHGIAGCVALGLGMIQFLRPLRRRAVRLHRAVGSIYLVSVFIGGAAALPMALMAFGGVCAIAGFTLLAILWLASGALALRALLVGHIRQHGRWMIRNYALTFSAIMVRGWLSVFDRFDVPLEVGYAVVAWISWVPALVIAELLIRYVTIRGAPTASQPEGTHRSFSL
ncbi:MAG: DUF2306 domain-containing protein [Candidatus Sumerlaeaceae bacterium]|nr:DUF2306 domain-containing protein [Candidatus Sumerlaeaceae bacterium]